MTQYRRYLGVFRSFCQSLQIHELRELKQEHLNAYRLHLHQALNARGQPLSPAHLAITLSKLRGFLSWALERGLLHQEFKNLTVPNPVHLPPAVPTVEAIQELLSVPDVETPIGLRDRVVLEFFYSLGLRLRECLGTDLEHLDLVQKQLRVLGKNDRTRMLPVPESLLPLLQQYLDWARPLLRPLPGEQALLISTTHGSRIEQSSLARRLRAYGLRVGIDLHPHLLRHACAAHLLAGGAELRYIQELLGHSRLENTVHYAQLLPLELRREFLRCHPRARKEKP